ncbi:hypothetical protein JYU04_04080 [Dehalococcoides mccartyi]|nr:hypothetical protein [Dehalococcoides mccartyi]
MTYTFAVDAVAKGSLSEFVVVQSSASGASCGFEGPLANVGGYSGILLRFDDNGNYASGLCSTISPPDLYKSVDNMTKPEPSAIHQWIPYFSNTLRNLFTEYFQHFNMLRHQ